MQRNTFLKSILATTAAMMGLTATVAHAADPLAGLEWQAEDFAWLTRRIRDLADSHCAGRVVSCLEGGYDLPALTASVAAHVAVLQERGK